MDRALTDTESMAVVAAGVSMREAVKHLLIASRILRGLELSTIYLDQVVQHFADLSYDLDPDITPYPTMADGLAAAAVE